MRSSRTLVAGNPDCFVTKSFNALRDRRSIYSTYLGGNRQDKRSRHRGGQFGQRLICSGHTTSSNFPTANAFQPNSASNNILDVYVTKLNPAGSALVYSTLSGGHRQRGLGGGIAVDSSGNAYVVGETVSTDFPTASALQPNIMAPPMLLSRSSMPPGRRLSIPRTLVVMVLNRGLGIAQWTLPATPM